MLRPNSLQKILDRKHATIFIQTRCASFCPTISEFLHLKNKSILLVKKFQFIFAFILAQGIYSCTSDPVTSYNVFIIDNQLSIDLFYKTGSGLDERTIEVSRLNLTEIDDTEFDGDRLMLISGEEFFTRTEDDIYLLKEVSGNLIEALQLNTTGVLNWETQMVDDFTYNHILVVTDELLN